MAKKRTVMRSKAGKKLYAVRDEEGQFADIQTYERAHGQDVQRKGKAEIGAAAKKKKAVKAAKPAKGIKKAKKKSAKRSKKS